MIVIGNAPVPLQYLKVGRRYQGFKISRDRLGDLGLTLWAGNLILIILPSSLDKLRKQQSLGPRFESRLKVHLHTAQIRWQTPSITANQTAPEKPGSRPK